MLMYWQDKQVEEKIEIEREDYRRVHCFSRLVTLINHIPSIPQNADDFSVKKW